MEESKKLFKSYFAIFCIGFVGGAMTHHLPGTDLSNAQNAVKECDKLVPEGESCSIAALPKGCGLVNEQGQVGVLCIK